MNAIAVYCGSSPGNHTDFCQQAAEVGHYLATQQITLVYGGAAVGTMGALATAALKENGQVIGVMPRVLTKREISNEGCTQLIVVDTMHERKQQMMDHADGFIALPGGPGTMEELFEVWTWAKINLHSKPIGVLNKSGFFDAFLNFIQEMEDAGFLTKAEHQLLCIAPTIEELVRKMQTVALQETK